jgi:hypothetical protein
LKSLREETVKLREDFNKLYESVMRRLGLFDRKITALGARRDLVSERAFRRAMKGVLEEILGARRVEKWRIYDERGEVFGYPAEVEIDLVIKNGVHILVEIKTSASIADLAKLWRVRGLYAKVTGVKSRLVLISPFIDEWSVKAARDLGVEVYTGS